jgi:mono/diheme cytochrome c family protein
MLETATSRSLGIFAATAAGLAAAATPSTPSGLDARWEKEVLPLVETYCHDCHGDGLRKGELAIDHFGSIAEMQQNREVWKRIRDHIRHRLMPPPDEDQLADAERNKLLAWIDEAVFPVDPANPDPGRVTLRRLNRIEYQNTLRDLLGVKADVMALIPPDDSGYGFDNIGDVLTLSPAHLERYLEASRIALDMAVKPGDMPRLATTVSGRVMRGDGQRSEEGHYLFTGGEAGFSYRPSRPGKYLVTVTACGTMGAEVAPLMELHAEDRKLHEWSVDAPMDRPKEYTRELNFEHDRPLRLTLAFTNDFWDEHHPDPSRRDRNLMIHSVTVTGPLDGPPPPKPESHRRILVDRKDGENDRAYALRVLNSFASKAFRRPAREAEVERYLELVALAESEGVEHGILLALEAMLVSPAFLYREEPQPEPDNAKKIQQIDEHSLATRLSYFFWSTMPDARLRDLADRGELRKNLDAELDRLIRDPRSQQFVSNFTGQWLRLRDVEASLPARREFPRFNPRLRDSMRRETEMLFDHIVRNDLPMATLLDASFTFLNDDLARHYGIDGVKGDGFRKVDLADTRRHGILGHGSFHLLTSYPLRTSPVLRGKYVLESLLDTAPPPPPPNIPQLEPPSRHGDQRSLREQMERHREDPACSSCHALMDPIGFGLENFDATGAWRDRDNGKPIDSSGQLIDGHKFQGVEELRKVLVNDHRSEFHRSVASKLLTYALGRGLDWYDKPALDRIVTETEAANGSSRALIRAVVDSVPFQYRRGDS